MKTPLSVRKIILGPSLMFLGVLLMSGNFQISNIFGHVVGDTLFQLSIGIAVVVMGFVLFTSIPFLTNQKKKKRIHTKSTHELIEIFGLE